MKIPKGNEQQKNVSLSLGNLLRSTKQIGKEHMCTDKDKFVSPFKRSLLKLQKRQEPLGISFTIKIRVCQPTRRDIENNEN